LTIDQLKKSLSRNEHIYFMHEEIGVIKIYDFFQIAYVQSLKDCVPMYIDISSIKCEPDFTNSLSISLFCK